MQQKPSRTIDEWRFRQGRMEAGHRIVPEEVPVAFSYGGSTHAVMMATPADLIDFAYGFSLAEEIVTSAEHILEVDLVEAGRGIDVQITLKDTTADALVARRRRMAGPVGCGLCGIESIEQATRAVAKVKDPSARLMPRQISEAIRLLGDEQSLNRETRAVHGAGFYRPEDGIVAVREDVGRHNALDKLSGAILRSGRAAADGVIVVTSRLSVEMVQKTALLGCPVLVAISAPTALAIKTAEEAGISLIGIARGDEFEVFTRPDRLASGENSHVA